MPVDRCICAGVSFRELIERARRDNLTLEQLKERTGCCTGCAMCEPYVRLALRTGRDAFDPLSADEAARVMREELDELSALQKDHQETTGARLPLS